MIATQPDYYAVLNVPRGVDPLVLRKAWRDIAKACHPDVAGDDARAIERFKEARAAYEVLKDPVKRAAYDSGIFVDTLSKIAGVPPAPTPSPQQSNRPGWLPGWMPWFGRTSAGQAEGTTVRTLGSSESFGHAADAQRHSTTMPTMDTVYAATTAEALKGILDYRAPNTRARPDPKILTAATTRLIAIIEDTSRPINIELLLDITTSILYPSRLVTAALARAPTEIRDLSTALKALDYEDKFGLPPCRELFDVIYGKIFNMLERIGSAAMPLDMSSGIIRGLMQLVEAEVCPPDLRNIAYYKAGQLAETVDDLRLVLANRGDKSIPHSMRADVQAKLANLQEMLPTSGSHAVAAFSRHPSVSTAPGSGPKRLTRS